MAEGGEEFKDAEVATFLLDAKIQLSFSNLILLNLGARRAIRMFALASLARNQQTA